MGATLESRPLWVKVCGFTIPDEACAVVELGVDAIGLVLATSSRRVTLKQAVTICSQLPPNIERVGVFVDATLAIMMQAVETAGITTIQLHGNENPDVAQKLLTHGVKVIKAIKVPTSQTFAAIHAYQSVGVSRFLFDAVIPGQTGGTGRTCDWVQAGLAAQHVPVILAGGLHPGNVAQAVRQVQPWGVDVSSGVEDSPGRKNIAKITAFIDRVRMAEDVACGR